MRSLLHRRFIQHHIDILGCVGYNISGDRMNMILSTVFREKQRIEYMLGRYQADLAQLPKGTLSEKAIGQKTYCYLKYRDGKKVISRYIRREDVDDLRQKIEKRRHIEAMIKSLREELVIADKILEDNDGFVSRQ